MNFFWGALFAPPFYRILAPGLSPWTGQIRLITTQQVFAERGAFHPVSKHIASFHTLATRSKQTLACLTLHILRPFCDLESPWCNAMRLGLHIPGILPKSCSFVWTICWFIQTGLVSRPDCVCVHLDGQTFSYHAISYHSVMYHGRPTFLCQRSSLVIVACFAGCMRKNKWYT